MDYLGETLELGYSEDDHLDIKFRQILYAIKQYIPYVNSNYHLSMYRLWLETLSTSDCDKNERNKYLLELARQIQNKTLLPPFDQRPSPGSLRNLPKINNFQAAHSEIPTLNNVAWPVSDDEDQSSPSSMSFFEQNYSTDLSYPTEEPFSEKKKVSYHAASENQTHDLQKPSRPMEPVDSFYYETRYSKEEPTDTSTSCQKNKKRKSKSGRNLQQVATEMNFPKDSFKKHENNSEPVLLSQRGPSRDYPINDEVPKTPEQDKAAKDDSSWCDLTDNSVTSIVNALASGDAEKSIQINQHKVEKANEITRISGDSISEITGEIEMRKITDSKGSTEEDKSLSTRSLSEDIEPLNCKDVNLSKHGLKDTNFISADWKNTIEALQLRLTETLNQNNELKAVINALQMKLKDDAGKNKDQNDPKQKKGVPFDASSNEIEVLKQIQVENVRKLEKQFQIKLDEAERSYQQKIEKVKISYENKIRELRSQQENLKREQDRELFRLTEIIQQQCIRMTNEITALRNQVENSLAKNNSEDKIIVLQKCVSKMDKLFQRSEKDYQKQIDKLKQELVLKDKVMQIQLKTQRADLITRTSAEKQRQFDDVVNSLEIKYIQMLEFHENQVMESRQQDEEKIEQLKELLDRNDIQYDISL